MITQMLELNKNLVIESYLNGKTTIDLAQQFHCNSGTIYYVLKKWNVNIRSHGYNKLGKQHDKVLELYKKGCSAHKIAQELGCKKSSVLAYFKKHGLSTSHLNDARVDKLVYHKDEIIKAYLNGESALSIAKRYNAAQPSVRSLLMKNKVICRDNRQHYFDEKFLNSIGEAQAYFLGLAFTDGNNRRDGFRLAMCDKDAIENVKNMLQYTGEIKELKPKNERCKPQYLLEVFSKQFAERLTELGCHPAKTHDLRWPQYIKGDLVRPFIQGCLEGDGSITKNYINFTGNKYLMAGIHSCLVKVLGIKCKWYKQKRSWSIFISTKEDRLKFLHWVYDHASLYMDRKYQAFKLSQ